MSIIEMKVPTIGESITEVTLSQWLKKDGDYINIDEPICEFESDKATLEFPAEAAGKLIYVAAEGDDLEIGALVAKIDTSVAAPASSPTPPAEPTKTENATPAVATSNYATGHPSPAAAKTLREKGIDANAVQGTGKDGRITKADADKAQTKSIPTPAAAPTPPSMPAKDFSRNTRREKNECCYCT